MDRVTGNTVDLGGGKRGWRNRNLGAGQAGTIHRAEWFNPLQEELIAGLIEGTGQTATDLDWGQIAKGAKRIGAGNSSSFAASTSLSPDHAGVVFVSAAAGNVVLTMPEADAAGGVAMRFTFVRTDGSGNTVTLQRAAADLIEGIATLAVPVGGRITLVGSGGAAWVVQAYLPFPAPYVPPAPWAAPSFYASATGFFQLSGNRPGDPTVYLQWGFVGGADDVPGSGSSIITGSFAFTFPNALLRVVGTLVDNGAGAGVLVGSGGDAAGPTFVVSEYTPAVQSLGVSYLAVGF